MHAFSKRSQESRMHGNHIGCKIGGYKPTHLKTVLGTTPLQNSVELCRGVPGKVPQAIGNHNEGLFADAKQSAPARHMHSLIFSGLSKIHIL